jgi:hypothetical protein
MQCVLFLFINKYFYKKVLNLKNEETGKLIQKKIPSTIDIKRLKVLVSKLLKSSSMDLESVRLYYSSLKV